MTSIPKRQIWFLTRDFLVFIIPFGYQTKLVIAKYLCIFLMLKILDGSNAGPSFIHTIFTVLFIAYQTLSVIYRFFSIKFSPSRFILFGSNSYPLKICSI